MHIYGWCDSKLRGLTEIHMVCFLALKIRIHTRDSTRLDSTRKPTIDLKKKINKKNNICPNRLLQISI